MTQFARENAVEASDNGPRKPGARYKVSAGGRPILEAWPARVDLTAYSPRKTTLAQARLRADH